MNRFIELTQTTGSLVLAVVYKNPSWIDALRHVVGLAIAKVYNEYGDLISFGVNKSIWFDSDPPTQPRTHELSKQQWCLRIKAIVKKESGRFSITTTTDESSDE
jgi:hypothetical protein